MANYSFRLNWGIKIELCPYGVDIFLAPPNDDVYMHPEVQALGLKLLMTMFVRSALAFYQVVPSQFCAVSWCTALEFEAL